VAYAARLDMAEPGGGLPKPELGDERRSGLPDRRWRPAVDPDLDRLQAELIRRDLRIDHLENEVSALRRELDRKTRGIETLKRALERKQQAIDSLKRNLMLTREHVATLRSRFRTAEPRDLKMGAVIADQLRRRQTSPGPSTGVRADEADQPDDRRSSA
jgi:chromosome segregation ATPase